MRRSLPAALALACVLAVGCAKGEQSTTTTTSTDASPAAAPATPVSELSASPAAVASTAAAANATAGPAAQTPLPVSFTDIAGVNGEKEIVALGQLGALDTTGGAFRPTDPVKRRDFVRWMFKANNAVWLDQPTRQIRAAEATATSDFTDLAASDPDFRYVQGVSDAGITLGFPDKTFKPDQPLTREQMIAIKSGLDRGGVNKHYADDPTFARYNLPPWKDRADVSKTYVAAIATDVNDDPTDGAPRIDNIGRTFGAIAVFRPRQAVTRAQAAVLLNVIGAHDESTQYDKAPRSVAKLLSATPSAGPAAPSPSP